MVKIKAIRFWNRCRIKSLNTVNRLLNIHKARTNLIYGSVEFCIKTDELLAKSENNNSYGEFKN